MDAHSNTLTYPISPDYVKSWTPERAIAELIANALDEDPAATATWHDGVLTIEDAGPGIPEEGLILGYSPKDDTAIGQFGEGAKIASLVLARSEHIDGVQVETVGYGFVPTVQTRRILDGIAPRRGETPPQVLVYTFTPSTRTAGTRVTVRCPKAVADAAIARFRHLSEPGYVRPQSAAQVLLDGRPGRLFIGGVSVSEQPRMVASYDFPLAAAKRAQNRDRTVIDAHALTDLVRDALAACVDPAVVRRFVEHALGGGRLTEAEKYFPAVTDPRVRAVFRAVARDLFADRRVFYADRGVDEAALDLLDGAFELLTTNLDWASESALMNLLGVERARVARERRQDGARTKYVRLDRLEPRERTHLDAAVAAVRQLFGAASIDQVRVFTETTDAHLACADGFYQPSTGSISLARAILGDPRRTLEVVLHEAAHRSAHRGHREYADRTRGFEHELTAMLAIAVARATGAPGAAAPRAAAPAEANPQGVAADPVPAVRTALAELIADALPGACARAGVQNEAELSDSVGLHRNYLRLLAAPKPAGWRQKAGRMAPAVVANPAHLEVLGGALGIDPGVLWLGHMLCEGPRYGRGRGAGPQPGPWSARLTKQLPEVLGWLRDRGGVYAAAADRVAELAAGAEVDLASQEWQDFAVDVIAAERARLDLPAPVAGAA